MKSMLGIISKDLVLSRAGVLRNTVPGTLHPVKRAHSSL